MSLSHLSVDVNGDVFYLNRDCSIVGTQRKCGYVRRNNNEEIT